MTSTGSQALFGHIIDVVLIVIDQDGQAMMLPDELGWCSPPARHLNPDENFGQAAYGLAGGPSIAARDRQSR